jgi:hypothetical protein
MAGGYDILCVASSSPRSRELALFDDAVRFASLRPASLQFLERYAVTAKPVIAAVD